MQKAQNRGERFLSARQTITSRIDHFTDVHRMSDWQEFLLRPALRGDYFLQRASLEILCHCGFDEMSQWWAIVLLSGNGHCRKDAMTIPDYLAIGFLLLMPLVAARWFAQRKFELFPTGSDTQRRSPYRWPD